MASSVVAPVATRSMEARTPASTVPTVKSGEPAAGPAGISGAPPEAESTTESASDGERPVSASVRSPPVAAVSRARVSLASCQSGRHSAARVGSSP